MLETLAYEGGSHAKKEIQPGADLTQAPWSRSSPVTRWDCCSSSQTYSSDRTAYYRWQTSTVVFRSTRRGSSRNSNWRMQDSRELLPISHWTSRSWKKRPRD